jgi:hypothetical protein
VRLAVTRTSKQSLGEPMYQRFSMLNFRCFESLSLSGFSRVNLVSGMNNTGKTALLEAIKVHASTAEGLEIMNLYALRGAAMNSEDALADAWAWLFRTKRIAVPITLTSESSDGVTRTITATMQPAREYVTGPQPFPPKWSARSKAEAWVVELRYEDSTGTSGTNVVSVSREGTAMLELFPAKTPATAFISTGGFADPSADLQLISTAIEEGDDARLVRFLQTFDRTIKRVFPLVKKGGAVLYADLEGAGPMPVALFGEGLRRLLSIALRLRRHEVLLIDEVENGLHHSILQNMWQAVGRLAAEADVQVFATTHSLECIQAAARALGPQNDITFYRLERHEDGIKAIVLNADTLTAGVEFNLEVR